MKNLLFTLLTLFAIGNVQAQIFTEDGRYELFGKDDPNLYKATGSPYLNDNFVPGKIFFKGKPDLPVQLRFNIYAENFEIKVDKGKRDIYTVSDWENAVYEMGGKKFVSAEIDHNGRMIKGFFIEHFSGDQYKLLEKPEIKVTPPVRSDSGYSEDQSAKIKKSSSFYIQKDSGEIVEVKLKNRDIKKEFTSAAAKKYLSDNKIREVEDLIAFLEFLEKEV